MVTRIELGPHKGDRNEAITRQESGNENGQK
jgi:hypothetical protein